MTTRFERLNAGWNAQPNGPRREVKVSGTDLELEFDPNAYQFPEYARISKIVLTFKACWRYRLGTVNDEGWYRGQCRFSGVAPAWGEFYEVSGDLKLDGLDDWVVVSDRHPDTRHFLFYFRDREFECDARSWSKREIA